MSSAEAGVDQTMLMGCRHIREATIPRNPIITLVTIRPEAACFGAAPDGFETLEHDRKRACIADHGCKHADGYRLD